MNRFQSWYRMQPAALRALLTINVGIYVLWLFLLGRIPVTAAFFAEYLALNPALPALLYKPWQLVTYNFLHLGLDLGGFLHILFNMLWLVWIGREYEEMNGAHRLMALYLIAGFGGGLLTVLYYVLFPSVAHVIVYGASASVLGVLTAVAVLYPYKSVALLFIGTVRLIYVVLGFLAIDLLFMAGSGTAVTAHVGGAFFGFLFARAERRGIDLTSWAQIFFRSRRSRRPARRPAPRTQEEEGLFGRMESWLTTRGTARENKPRKADIRPIRSYTATVHTAEEGPLASEVDRILDKISAQGYEALTEEEKQILYDASRR